eukprot:10239539-Heterocapsa_arctica.AAC.1
MTPPLSSLSPLLAVGWVNVSQPVTKAARVVGQGLSEVPNDPCPSADQRPVDWVEHLLKSRKQVLGVPLEELFFLILFRPLAHERSGNPRTGAFSGLCSISAAARAYCEKHSLVSSELWTLESPPMTQGADSLAHACRRRQGQKGCLYPKMTKAFTPHGNDTGHCLAAEMFRAAGRFNG